MAKGYEMMLTSRRTRRWHCHAIAVIGLVGLSASLAAQVAADEAKGLAVYQREVLPILNTFCGDCHGADLKEDRWSFPEQGGNVDLLADVIADRAGWRKVQELVEYRIMPPHDEAVPTVEQRRNVLDWIENTVFFVDPQRPDPGDPGMRRLNRAEYNNTVRDILGVTSRPADPFPDDDSGYGFDNIGEVLTVSTLHFEKYLAAARKIAEELTQPGPPPRVGIELQAGALTVFAGSPMRTDSTIELRTVDEQVGTEVDVPVPSVYRILTRASSDRDAPTPLDVLCDGQPLSRLEATGSSFALVELPAGRHQIALRLAAVEKPNAASPTPAKIRFLSVGGPFAPVRPFRSAYLQQMLPSRQLGAPVLRISGEDLEQGTGRSSLDTGRAWFSTNGYRHAPVQLPRAGEYRVRLKVGAQQVGDEPVQLEVRLSDTRLGPFAVAAQSQAEQWIETTCQLPAGKHDWQVWFINEYRDPETGAERWLWLHELSLEGPLDANDQLSRPETIDLLQRTGRRLFRRPLTDAERLRLERLVEQTLVAEQTLETALRVGLEALLVSPSFLYHPRPVATGDPQHGTARIDEFTLASRLSYFLWSSAPDEELLALAESGQLRRQFAEEVKRMLKDPKAVALTENFAGQWLQLRNLEHVTPDETAFADFDRQLAADMRRETELLFEHILYGNRSVLDFLQADYTFVNARLAKHYGLPILEDRTSSDQAFQRVSLAGTQRRGVTTHGSVLTMTSLPTRTSPVKRGQWVLEQLLGAEPPPAPGNVPSLPVAPEDASQSLRERLEQHIADPACASCHALLDPMGFALENFDAIGRWRTRDASGEIDASGELLNGTRFSDWAELREILPREYSEDFLQCFTEQLLTYALGRGLTYRDKTAVGEILRSGATADYGFQDIIFSVCQSVPFQRMVAQHGPTP